MKPNKIVDKHAFCVKINDEMKGHLSKGPHCRFAKIIFFSHMADEFSSCTAVFKGKQLNFREFQWIRLFAKSFLLNIFVFGNVLSMA